MSLKPLIKPKECRHGRHIFSYCKDCCFEILERNRILAVIGISEETLDLAKLIAKMPPLLNDAKTIEEWVKRLAIDISKGRD